MRIAEGHREVLGFAQTRQDAPKVARGKERRGQAEPEIDGLLKCIGLLWQMWEGTERLLEILHGFAVGRSRHGLFPRLPAVRQGLSPHLTPQSMVRQPFD